MTFNGNATPPRDPFPVVPSEAFVAPEEDAGAQTPAEDPEAPENGSQAPQKAALKINLTYLTQLEGRASVMQDRVQSFIRQLELVGVTDPNNTDDPFVRGILHDALRSISSIEKEVAELHLIVARARQALASL